MPKKGVSSTIRNHQHLEYLLTSGWYMKLFQQGAIKFFKTQPGKRRYLEYMPEGNLETQLPLIRVRFGLPEKMEARSFYPLPHISHDNYIAPKSYKDSARREKLFEKQRVDFLKTLSPTDRDRLTFAVKWIALSHGLDFLWHQSIANMIISGYYMAPHFNLALHASTTAKEVSIQLTGTTTLEDIRYAHEAILEYQKGVFGSPKKRRYSERKISLADLIRTSEQTIGQIEEYNEPTSDRPVIIRKTLEDALAFFEEEGKIMDLPPKKRRLFKQKIRTGISRKKKLIK